MKEKKWYRLDNAAKIYPPTTNSRRGATFALSATLTEQIDDHILTDAVNEVLVRFPSFKTCLKRGVFWYYLEENTKPFEVKPLEAHYLKPINPKDTNDYLFRVYYRERTITMVVYHVLGDGNGAMEVFKSLIYEYLKLSGKKVDSTGLEKPMSAPHTESEIDDTFKAVYDKTKGKRPKEGNAFKTYGTPFGWDGCGLMLGKAKIEQVKEVAKKYDCTITALLGAISMYACYLGFIRNKKVKNKNVKILVPVNMRKWYPSETVRNFALFVRLSHNFSKEITLEDCIELCKTQLKDGLTRENLDAIITANVKSERNPFVKIVPLAIKDVIMRLVYTRVGDNLHTYNLSNLGLITLPESVSKYVTDIVFNLGASYSCKSHMAVVSYKDNIYVSFSRLFVENYMEREFFGILSGMGVDVEIHSNYWEANL